LNGSVWAPRDPRKTSGSRDRAAKKLAGGDGARWSRLLEMTGELVKRLAGRSLSRGDVVAKHTLKPRESILFQ
jgi:hypothetical protein